MSTSPNPRQLAIACFLVCALFVTGLIVITTRERHAATNHPTPGSYTITPSKTNYKFNPTRPAVINLAADQSGINYVAIPKTYNVPAGTSTNVTGTGP